MKRLMDEPEERARIGAAGRAYVEEHHNWDEVWERYESALANVIH